MLGCLQQFPKGQHLAHQNEDYDLNLVAGMKPKVLEPAMKVREVTVGTDYHGRPYKMVYFHAEEVLASMRTEGTLRDHWVDRAEPRFADVERRVCTCERPCDPPCTKPSTAHHPHGVVVEHQRVFLHTMDSDAAIDAQRRMEAAGHTIKDPKNGPCIIMSGEDKVRGGAAVHCFP